jgi:hypothetical protein
MYPHLWPKEYFFYFRFIDDIIIASQYGELHARKLLKTLNALSPSSFFTIDVNSKVQYCDLRVYGIKNENGTYSIHFRSYDKPMNLHIYSHPDSYFPQNYVDGWFRDENIALSATTPPMMIMKLASMNFASSLKEDPNH